MDSSPFDFSVGSQPPTPRAFHIAYWKAYTFLFEKPNWLANLLLAMLCQLIPVVGPIVLLGYEYELILALHRRQHPHAYPDFDFGRFSEYLTRGVWPFLVNLIQAMICVPFMYVAMIVCFVLITFISFKAGPPGQAPNPAIFVAILPLLFLFITLLTTIMGMISMPMRLRAGLSNDFGEAFNFKFVKDFIRLVGWEMVLAYLFMIFTAPFVMLAGMLVFFVGVFLAGTLIFMAFSHLNWQLYELYLSRGGTPILIPEDDIYDAEVI